MSAKYPIKIRVYDRVEKTMKPLESYNSDVMKKLVVLMTDPSPNEDERYVFCRYIGLQDTKGRDIYEGDIVQGTSMSSVRTIIEWRDEKWLGWPITRVGAAKQIVGNIYTKPLKKNQAHTKRPPKPNARYRHAAYKTYSVIRSRAQRGLITADERWLDKADGFENFVADVGPRPPFKVLSRYDMKGPFNKDNCYWDYTAIHDIRSNKGGVNRSLYGQGISFTKGGGYKVTAGSVHGNSKIHIGTYDTVEEARAAREAYIDKLRRELDEKFKWHQNSVESS